MTSSHGIGTVVAPHGFKFPSIYTANLSAMLSSLQSTAPFSMVPRVIAFLCTVTNCLFNRCSSARATLRGGIVIRGLSVPLSGRVTDPPDPMDMDCSAMNAETIAAVVDSSARSASVGALGI